MWVGLNLDFNLRAHHGFSVIEVAANSIHDYRKVIKEIESGGFGTYAIASGYREYQYNSDSIQVRQGRHAVYASVTV